MLGDASIVLAAAAASTLLSLAAEKCSEMLNPFSFSSKDGFNNSSGLVWFFRPFVNEQKECTFIELKLK